MVEKGAPWLLSVGRESLLSSYNTEPSKRRVVVPGGVGKLCLGVVS